MATTFYLVRHAAHGLLGRVLTGRMPEVHLAESGRLQAQELARHFKAQGIDGVQSSPRERAEETARPIADEARVACELDDALDEIDFGEWTGRSFEELEADPRWQLWNAQRSAACAPGGESMAAVQDRLIGHLRRTHAAKPGARLVLVSHGDVIKAAILHVLGMTVDAFAAFEISPAGISTVVLGQGGGATVLSLNERIAR